MKSAVLPTLRILAKAEQVKDVEVLCYPNRLAWHQDNHGLHVSLPTEPVGEHAFVFKISL